MEGLNVIILKNSFQRRFAYKVNTLLNIFGTFITIFIQISLWKALYQGKSNIASYTIGDMYVYIIINSILLPLTNSNVANKIGDKVTSGSIVIDLIRPISLKNYMFFEEFGENIYNVIFALIPICFFIIIFKIGINFNLINLFMFLLSCVFGIVLMYYFNYILGLLAFWLKDTWYISWYSGAFFSLFGGVIIPLNFYPIILQKVSYLLHFRLITYEPINIALNKNTLNQDQ
jgi:ABC-2 type transport system permease protein